MQRRSQRVVPSAPAAVLLAAILLSAACGLLATRISAIQESPDKYHGRTVSVAGTVAASHNMLFVKYYQVDDGTGRIWVVTQGALPKEGDRVRVRGTVNQAFAVGSAHLVVIVEEPPKR